ncbi:piggyBac transposable element-derived protein 4-like [Sipha flava]|uniref:PiggyBac transposable element-derived protein 4-like n=1 Tax=Sipha flava TaxID=143950 RepID=A0A8B8GFM9_9HEMI|nr:piggyBac transposable element-derived protein 4-like [Sipha flava]
MSISFSHDINIRESNRTSAIVLLIHFNFEKARSEDELDTGKFLVEEENSYAVEVFLNSDRSNSRTSTWKNTDVVEMKKCIALLFHTGTIRLRVLHFCKIPEQNDNPTSRLHKIDKMTNYFNKTMEELYQPSKNVSIDESMVLFRGRLMFRQYIKNKRHKYGIKLYMMTESWGLVHRVLIYSGKGIGTSEELNHTEYVVKKLMEGYYYKGHSIYMDNYYNSVKIAHYLLEKQTYCTEKGVGVVKWKDRRYVIAISSEHSHDLRGSNAFLLSLRKENVAVV